MTSWRGLRHEIAGAWRSLRYDLDRRQARPADDEEETTDLIFPEYGTARPPRRLLAAGGFGALAVAGAVGTYFAVATGLGLLIDDGRGQPSALPGTAGNRAAVSDLGAAELGDDRIGVDPPDRGVGVGMVDDKGATVTREGRRGGRITDAGKQAAVVEAGGDPTTGPPVRPSPTRTKPTTPGPRPSTPKPSPTATTSSPTPSPSPSTGSPSPSPSETTGSPSPTPSESDPGEDTGEETP